MTDQRYSRLDFTRLALAEFPELREEFDEYPDLLHLQMHALERLAERTKNERDWMLYRRIMLFADRLWQRPDQELLNALNVSFLEHLEFAGTDGPRAWGYLSSELKEGWRAMDAYMTQLAEAARAPRKQRRPKPRRPRR
jgi:hypothetical protein